MRRLILPLAGPLGLALACLSVSAYAQDPAPSQDRRVTQDRVVEEIIVDGSDLPVWAIRKIEPMRSKVSGWVDATSRSLDSYFGTDEFLDVDNKSYLRISQEMEWMDSEGVSHSMGTRYKVDMPTTKKRLKLVFESNPEETQSEEEERNRRAANRDLEETKNSTVIGIERTSEADPQRAWKVRANAGLKLRAPLDPYVRVTTRRQWQLDQGPWSLESHNRVSWFNSDGYSLRSRWQFSRTLSATSSVRHTSNVQWKEEEDTLQFSQRAELSKVLNERSALRWALIVEAESASNPRIEDYYAQVIFRRDLHDQVLFLDLVPELHFAREDDFEPRWAVIARLEFYFRADFVKE